MEYIKGKHYNRFLTVDNDVNKTTTRVTKVVKTNYGYRFLMFNNYITLFYGKLVINVNGTAKLTMTVKRNYCDTYQYTLYFDDHGFEIKSPDNNNRKELLIYKSINNN
jgi:hypothetical protein